MTPDRSRRRDARENAEKLRSAALEAFLADGLGAPLEAIARAAGVKVGTLYNHFGNREGLIDAVVPEVLARRLLEVTDTARSQETARDRLDTFVRLMIDLLEREPALSDALLRRYPEAGALSDVCERNAAIARTLVHDAHRSGSLAESCSAEDVLALIWLAAAASRATPTNPGWRRVIDRAMASAWTAPDEPARSATGRAR
ncbi:TetR/AcrR family transcriptional regulator [Actinophytocola gossypii]|uniref:TetR/AcrR family transcriptional regulator n=1 Tax=Actinophytocola gossypii TaxID=2812003 RepID=A0ABT2J6M8_9PSEU|nr:TetR/AcrR family transcriptional regulator [Actinophytocola gossypii]MCT2582924.1 TetR/AcrR family transcriptional regulator [Actinophytocola gossypii]